MTKYEQILNCLPLKFEPPLEIPSYPQTGIIRMEKGNGDTIYAQVWSEGWRKLEETDRNYDLVADAIINRLNETLPKSKDYRCPNCNEWHNDDDRGYEVDGIHYPIYKNEVKGSTMDGSYHDWDEIHKCENCKTQFWFRNGAF